MTKEEAIKILRGDVLGTDEQTHEAVFMAIKALKEQPTIDAEPVKYGYWINVPRPGIQCSKCKATIIVEQQYAHYCPNCGVKMKDEIIGWTQLQDYRT